MVKQTKDMNNKELLAHCEKRVKAVLDRYNTIEFVKAKLHLISIADYQELLQIDSLLMPLRKGTRKTNVYSISTFVSIVNPKDVAVSYTLTPVEKRKQIADIEKIIATLPREAAVTKEKLQKEFDEYVNSNEDLSEDAYNDLKTKLVADFKAIDEQQKDIEENPDKYKDKVKIASNPVLHAQIRYYYFDKNGEKFDEQKHLSSEKPSVLVFDDNIDGKKRKDNKLTRFLRGSKRVFGDLYISNELI